MLEKILERFGYVPVSKLEDTIEAVKRMANERNVLKAEIVTLRTREGKERSIIDTNIGDTTPTDSEARKMYVASVAGFFKNIMEPKLKEMISVAHNVLEERDSDRDFDLILKGIIYSYRDLIRWGESMLNEQISYTANKEEEMISEEEVNTLKDKLN